MEGTAGSPIVLVALDEPDEGLIRAYREGEPSFVWVHGLSDALMSAASRGVDLVIPAALYEVLREDLPELPPWVIVV